MCLNACCKCCVSVNSLIETAELLEKTEHALRREKAAHEAAHAALADHIMKLAAAAKERQELTLQMQRSAELFDADIASMPSCSVY